MKSTTVLLALVLTAFSVTAFAQSNNNPPPLPGIITVTGSAQIQAIPDQATVRIGIVHQAKSARDAQQEASRVGAAILGVIQGLGVAPRSIQTSRLTVSPVYSQQVPGPNNLDIQRIASYVASNTITVTLDNLALIGPVVDAGLDNGANQLEGVRFTLKDDKTVREQALRLAVAEAKGKAAAIADALLVTLGPIVEIVETGESVVPLRDRGEATFAMAARAPNPTPVSPGQLDINASVEMKIAIIPRY